MKKRTFVAEMAFLKILIKSLNLAENPKKLAENPITSKKLAGRISPDTSLFGCMSGKFPDSPEKISAYESCKNMSRDESNLRSLSVRRKNKLRAFDTNVTKKFTHFVRKVFAREILPTRKF